MRHCILIVVCTIVTSNILRAQDYINEIEHLYSSVDPSGYFEKIDTLTVPPYLDYEIVNKYKRSKGDRVLVLNVTLIWDEYVKNNVIGFGLNNVKYPFDIYIFDKRKVKCFIIMDSDGIFDISKKYATFIKGYYRKISRALSKIRSIDPDYILKWDFVDSYLFVKNDLMYVYSIEQNRSFLLAEYIDNNLSELSAYYGSFPDLHKSVE